MAEYRVRVCGVGPDLTESSMTEEITENKEKFLKMEEKTRLDVLVFRRILIIGWLFSAQINSFMN